MALMFNQFLFGLPQQKAPGPKLTVAWTSLWIEDEMRCG